MENMNYYSLSKVVKHIKKNGHYKDFFAPKIVKGFSSMQADIVGDYLSALCFLAGNHVITQAQFVELAQKIPNVDGAAFDGEKIIL